MPAGVLARTFFEQRHTDLDKTAETLELPGDEREGRWEELYSELFLACEDLDLDFESQGPMSEYAIPESEFRKRIDALQSRLHALLLAPAAEPSTARQRRVAGTGRKPKSEVATATGSRVSCHAVVGCRRLMHAPGKQEDAEDAAS